MDSEVAPVAPGTLGTRQRHLFLWFGFANDEELLAGFDQAQLAARDFLDGGRVFPQTTRLFAKPGVFGTRVGERSLDRFELAACLQERDQPLLAEDRVDDQNSRDKRQHVPRHTPAAARHRALWRGRG